MPKIVKNIPVTEMPKDFPKMLAAMLEEASEHLDYCGYGDSWERECAGDLRDRIAETLEIAKKLRLIK